ncbi:fibronectin type III domain-containing protein [Pedobacter sp. L105]|uniref:fibronectin type III domain-containing protein n=1 Tax=Pedobacter sp. L105 TaxID=1641871 RepID=UPI00131D0961|nr:fibronectin type III domain-containing protein [Pedobacter sp. L105]
MTTIPSLLTTTDLPDQQPNVAGSYTHTQYNLLKNSHLALLNFVLSLVDPATGLILSESLPEENLLDNFDSTQFAASSDEVPVITIPALGSGQILLPAATLSAGTPTSTTVPLTWTAVANSVGYQPQQLIGSTWTNVGSVITALSLTVTGLTASTSYSFKVIAEPSTGYTASTSNVVTASTIASGGTTPTVLRTLRINLQSEFAGAPSTGSVIWNNLNPVSSLITAANGYTSGFLNTDAGVATTAKLSNVTAFSGATAAVTDSANITNSLYPIEIVNTGWEFDDLATNYGLKIVGLDPTKFYQILAASASIGSSADVSQYISGSTTVNQNTFNNFGTNGDNELTSTYYSKLANIQTDSSGVLTFGVKGVAGRYDKFLTTLLIQETNIAG